MREPEGGIQNREKGEPISEEWKRYIVHWSELKGNSVRAASDHFGVAKSTIHDWKKTVKEVKNLNKPGRPPLLDEEAQKCVYNEAQKKYQENETIPAGKVGLDGGVTAQDLILEGVKRTSERRKWFFNGNSIHLQTQKKGYCEGQIGSDTALKHLRHR